jgi:uncharacterized protein YegJ (DUF2314 family)
MLVSTLLAACAPRSRVSSPEADMNAAMQQAQKELPSFIKALQAPSPTQGNFAIKARFPYGSAKDAEYLWVNELKYSNGKFEGVLDSTPQYATNLHAGDHVTVQAPDVADWVIVDAGKLLGGFTIIALRNRMNAGDKVVFDAQFQFLIPEKPALP